MKDYRAALPHEPTCRACVSMVPLIGEQKHADCNHLLNGIYIDLAFRCANFEPYKRIKAPV